MPCQRRPHYPPQVRPRWNHAENTAVGTAGAQDLPHHGPDEEGGRKGRHDYQTRDHENHEAKTMIRRTMYLRTVQHLLQERMPCDARTPLRLAPYPGYFDRWYMRYVGVDIRVASSSSSSSLLLLAVVRILHCNTLSLSPVVVDGSFSWLPK